MKNQFFLIIGFFLVFSCDHQSPSAVDVDEISIEEMIGQMVMTGCRGLKIDDVSSVMKDQLRSGKIGGMVLFDYDVVNKEYIRNIESPGQVKDLINGFQELSEVPLLIAVDQEGGRVNRLKTKYGFPPTVSNQYLGDLNNLDTTFYYATRNATTLKSLGFNVNFAPAVDLNINTSNPVIGKIERSYSADQNVVVAHAGQWIKAHSNLGILSTLKHFPGHGSSDADSHYGVTDITKYWKEIELEPFKELSNSENNVAIMTAHVLNTNLDSVPATLSKNIIHDILRSSWEYEGLVFSDDMHMKAVNDMYDFKDLIRMTLEAGVDIWVYGNNLEYDELIPTKIQKVVLEMVKDGKITQERIKESYNRIMRVKKELNLIPS